MIHLILYKSYINLKYLYFHYEEGVKYLSDYQSRTQIEKHLLLKRILCHLVPVIQTVQHSIGTPCFIQPKTTSIPSEVLHKPVRLTIQGSSQHTKKAKEAHNTCHMPGDANEGVVLTGLL